MAKLGNNKKGSLLDIIYLALVIAFFGIVVLVGVKIGDEVNANIQSMDSALIDPTTKVRANTTMEKYTDAIDNGFFIFVIFMGIVTLALAALVRIHPIFIPLFILGLIFVIFLSAIFSNIYMEMATTTNLVATAEKLEFITNILKLLPLIIGVFGTFLMILMYKLWSVNQ